MMIGLFIGLLAMAVATYVLIIGITSQTFNYYGQRLSRSEHPLLFWFSMAVAILVLIIGARILPLWLGSLQ